MLSHSYESFSPIVCPNIAAPALTFFSTQVVGRFRKDRKTDSLSVKKTNYNLLVLSYFSYCCEQINNLREQLKGAWRDCLVSGKVLVEQS